MKEKTTVLLILGLILATTVLLSSCSLFGNPTVTISGTPGAVLSANQNDVDVFYAATNEVGTVVTVQEVQIVFAAGNNHGQAAYVAIELISPGGQYVTMFSPGDPYVGSADFANGGTYTFVDDDDDEGLVRLVTYSGVIVPETYQVDGDFDDFEGRDLKGTWTLRFRVLNSSLSPPAGTLTSWRAIIEYEEGF